ncbi:BrnT family toxin [Pollutimonas sp. M17]|uniref:BrnT family toxin n=1 Tax=Pollutimonas sp. M17 TaxID=2962065 RepID=UPI0021F4D986|nr:BrnT family toxin [Pollutimonas sp. M17]UYO93941.1 BrnT family toxin [Pollutimonas sp. M17]
MNIEFDPAKNSINEAKHGISLAAAEGLEWETTVVVRDCRFGYSESRLIGTGYIGKRLHVVVFVDRGDVRRIISLRRANDREVKRYAET